MNKLQLEQRISILEKRLGIKESKNIKSLLKPSVKFNKGKVLFSFRGETFVFEIENLEQNEVTFYVSARLSIKISSSGIGEFQDHFNRPSGNKKQLVTIEFSKNSGRFEEYGTIDPWDVPKRLCDIIQRFS